MALPRIAAGILLIVGSTATLRAFTADAWGQGMRGDFRDVSKFNESGKEFVFATANGHKKPGTASLAPNTAIHFRADASIQSISDLKLNVGNPKNYLRYRAADGDWLLVLVSSSKNGIAGGIHVKEIRLTTIKDARTGYLQPAVVYVEAFDHLLQTSPSETKKYSDLIALDGLLLIRGIENTRLWPCGDLKPTALPPQRASASNAATVRLDGTIDRQGVVARISYNLRGEGQVDLRSASVTNGGQNPLELCSSVVPPGETRRFDSVGQTTTSQREDHATEPRREGE